MRPELLVLCLAALIGCKREAERAVAPKVELELFSWWTAEGEKEALATLLAAHRAAHPEVRIANIGVMNRSLDPERVLNWRMGLDDRGQPDRRIIPHPPSLVQWDLYDLDQRWLAKGIRFVALDNLYDAEGWHQRLYPFLDRGLRHDGHVLGLPLGLHRENSLIFHRALLRELGIAEAQLGTWEGFLAACETSKRSGRACLALTRESWVSSIVFRSVAAATMGPERFHAFFGRRGDRDDPTLPIAVASFKLLFDRGYVGGWDNQRRAPVAAWGWPHVREQGWAEAAKDLFRGRAAFFLHGDWSVALFKTLGWTSAELGVRAAPGTEGLFLLGVDGLVIPAGSDHQAVALEVLRTWGQPAVLAAFNQAKGSTPPRPDVDVSGDPLAQAVKNDLERASIITAPPIFLPADTELLRYVAGEVPLETAVAALRTTLYPPR